MASMKIDATQEEEVLLIKKLTEFATMPVRGSPLAAGFDLAAAYDLVVPAGGKAIAKTDLAMKIPTTCYGRIAPRSGLAWKKHIDVGAGVIDADYRGNVGVVLFNHSKEDLVITKGDRVAQLVMERISMMPAMEVDDLDATERGAGGFGSTGVSSSPKKQKTSDQ
jgi:deoxyuridine 5'-triphosphate nucleotidohydrolase